MIKSRKVKAAAAAVVLIVAAAVGFGIMSRGGGKKGGMVQETAVTVVRAETPAVGGISLTTGLTGTVEPSEEVHVYAKAGGDVTAVMVTAGDVVEQGQILFEIDTEQVETAKNTMDSAAVTLSEARSNLSRMQILYSSGDLSAQEYEQYVNAGKSAELQYESAKLAYERQVQYSSVTAPISGKIESCDVDVHDRVTQSQDLCVITGEGGNLLSFYVTQRMMKNCAVGDQLEIIKNDSSYSACISEINSMVDSSTGLFKVKARIEETGELAPGTTVKLNLVTDRTENAMLIPVDAVYYSGGQAYVYLYRDGLASMAQIEVGLEDSEHVEVLGGLSADDLVVSTWSSNLYEGANIRLRDEAAESGAAAGEEAGPGEESGAQAESASQTAQEE